MKRDFFIKDCSFITGTEISEMNKHERNPGSVYLRINLIVKEKMNVKLQEFPIYKVIKYNNEFLEYIGEKEILTEIFINNYRKNIQEKISIFKKYWKENEENNNKLKELINSVIITNVPLKGIYMNLFKQEELKFLNNEETIEKDIKINEQLEEIDNKFIELDLLKEPPGESHVKTLSYFSRFNWNVWVSLKQMLLFINKIEEKYNNNPYGVEKQITVLENSILVKYKICYETVNNETNNKYVNNIMSRLLDSDKQEIKKKYLKGEDVKIKIYKESIENSTDYFNTVYEIEKEFKRPLDTPQTENFEMQFRLFSDREKLRDFCLNILQYNYD